MPEENITPAETTPAGTTPDDSGEWDMARGMNTIVNLRELERGHKATIVQLRGAVAAMAAGRTDLPPGLADAMRAPASAAPTAEVAAYGAAFKEIAAAPARARLAGRPFDFPSTWSSMPVLSRRFAHVRNLVVPCRHRDFDARRGLDTVETRDLAGGPPE